MSDSRRDGKKGGGYRIRGRDFWSRRCRGGHTIGTGRYAKKRTLGIERMEQRALLKQAKELAVATIGLESDLLLALDFHAKYGL